MLPLIAEIWVPNLTMGIASQTSVSKFVVHLPGFRYRSKEPKEIGPKERQLQATA